MAGPQPRVASPKPAENDRAWPTLASLLAPAAGCDCQMLAVSLAQGFDAKTSRAAKIAER